MVTVWAGGPDDERSRRPTDVVLLIAAAVTLGVVVQAQPGGGPPGRALTALLRSWTFLHHVWWTLMLLATIAAVVLVVLAAIARRWRLVVDAVAALAVAAFVATVIYHLFRGDVDAVIPGDSQLSPVVRLAGVTAVFSVAAPHIVRPLRYATHGAVAVIALATVALAGTNVNGVLAALLTGWVAASGVHLMFGSPGGRPTVERVEASLLALEAGISDLRAVAMRRDGVAQFIGAGAAGPVIVRVYGRDAWNGQLVAAVSRFLTHRGPGSHLSLTRIQQAEHEALMSLVAERAGVGAPVTNLVAKSPNGDVVAVASHPDVQPVVGDVAFVAGAWGLVDRLHRADVAHRAIGTDQLALDGTGQVVFVDLDQAVLASDERSQRVDRAQVLATTLVLTDRAAAIDGFLDRHRSDAAVEAMLRFLQPAVMPVALRRQLKQADVDLEAARAEIAERRAIEPPELEKVRRITRGAIVTTLLIGLAATFVVSTFADLDWAEVRSALEGANWWWLVFAFMMAQSARLGGGFSMLGACRTPLPYGPVFLLQFSFPFIDVAAPAAAGRIAATMRFQQKYGVLPTAAFSASIIDSGAGFAAQIILMAITFAVTDLSLDQLGTDRFTVDFRLLMIILLVVAVIVSIILIIPVIRKRVIGHAREIWSALAVLKSPAKFALLLGGSALTEMICAVTMGLCLRSLGLSAPFASLLVVTAFVRFVSGVSPIPGGVGIAEAGLTAGLVSIGVPVELAFPAAMIYRLCTFYVPPAYGWAVLGVLRRRDYL